GHQHKQQRLGSCRDHAVVIDCTTRGQFVIVLSTLILKIISEEDSPPVFEFVFSNGKKGPILFVFLTHTHTRNSLWSPRCRESQRKCSGSGQSHILYYQVRQISISFRLQDSNSMATRQSGILAYRYIYCSVCV
ncbi:unnamed protein product, partial [Amoebophrya sp. A120]